MKTGFFAQLSRCKSILPPLTCPSACGLVFSFYLLGERVCTCACMRAPFVFLSRQLTNKKKQKQSCCLVTSLWLRIIYLHFFCQTFTKCSFLGSIVYSKSNALFLASIFCIAGLSHHVLCFCPMSLAPRRRFRSDSPRLLLKVNQSPFKAQTFAYGASDLVLIYLWPSLAHDGLFPP